MTPHPIHRTGTRPAAWAAVAAVLLALGGCGPSINVPPFSPAELARLQQEAAGRDTRGYGIAPGDTVLLRFPFHPEMDQEVLVRPDGKITVSGLGPVPASGLTAAELATELKERTSGHLRDPEVVVNIQRFGERPVYVGGEVGRPGTLVHRPGLTPLQAVIASGGFLATARIDSVILVRPKDGRQGYVARKLDLNQVVHDGEKEPIELAPNDVIFVPRTPIANANVWVRQHITDLFPFFRANVPMSPVP